MNLVPGIKGFQKTHGLWQSSEYRAWAKAKSRCTNPRDADYPRYGGRGIVMCSEWRESFATFFRDMGPKPAGTTLDRRENNGGYNPDNCRWATPTEQANNRASNLTVVFDGRRWNVAQWAAITGISRKTLTARLNKLHWSVRRTLTEAR